MSQNNLLSVAASRLRHFDRTLWFTLLLSTLSLIVLAFVHGNAGAQDARVVTIYADGTEQTFPTDSETVDQALERAGIELHEEDLVEPGLTTDITTDSFKINVYRARPVLVVDGDKERQVLTPYQSPRLIAKDAGLTVYPEDEYELERINDFIGQSTIGLKMTIDRATPIKLNMYGTVESVRTQAETVGEFVATLELSSDEGEVVVRPASDEPIKEGMTIHAVAVSDDTVAVEELIAFPRREIRDTSRPLGYEEVRTPGQKGSKLVTYKIKYENGQEVSRKEINSVVIEKPVEEVVVVGAKAPDVSGNAAIGQRLAAQRGWTGADWTCLYELWSHESGWNHMASNPSSGAYGIPQALPGHKMSSAGSDWATNPETQIVWGLGYISGRHGTPCGALNHLRTYNWY